MELDLNKSVADELWMQEVITDNSESGNAVYQEEVHNTNSHPFDLNVDALAIVDEEHQEAEGEVINNNLIPAPAVGDEFDSADDAYKHYKLYALQCGFGVNKRTSHKKEGYYYDYHFACSKHKKPFEKVSDGLPDVLRRRGHVGTQCRAFLKVTDSKMVGRWVVRGVCLDHNHPLFADSAFLIPTFRYIPHRYQRMLESNEDQGMTPSDNIESVLKHAGGYWKGTFTRRDARNHIDSYRRDKIRSIGGDDALLLTDYFKLKQSTDRNFWFSYKYTNEGRLWNIFWADGRSRALYKYFNDVVVLDATYLTNK